MADEIDLANDLIDNEVSRALSKMRQNSPTKQSGAKICDECGDEIPEARRKMGFSFCVSCAEGMERRQAQFAGHG